MLPFIMAGIALGAPLWGAKKGVDGLSAKARAKQREAEAQACIAEARERLDAARIKTKQRLELLTAARGDAERVIVEKAIPQL